MPLISEVVNWRGRVYLISEAVWSGEGVSYIRGSKGRGWVSLISEAPYPHALHPVFCAPVQHTYASVPVHHAPMHALCPKSMRHGAQDHGVQDHGVQDHGAQDHGAQNHGAQDLGVQSHGVQDYGVQDHSAQDHGGSWCIGS